MADVPVLVRVGVVAPMGNSDHSSLSAVISMAQAVPNMCVSRKVFLEQKVNCNTVCGAIQDQPTWYKIWLADNLLGVLNELLSLLVGRYVQVKVIFVRNKNKPWFDDRMQACFWPQQEAHLWWTRYRFGLTGKSLSAVKRVLMKPSRRSLV